jgi:RNA polymerase sigma-70 factor (ECF subfamily)
MADAASEEDIRRIYRETIHDLYVFVSRRCDRDRALAEDVTQETWLRAVSAWRLDGLPDRPLAWLATVAARLLSNHHRRSPMDPLDEETLNTLPSSESDEDESEASVSLVRRALARLPFPQMRLLKAFHYDRRAVAEIAALSGLSERAVEGRLRRARQNLRREIETDRAPDGEHS